MAEKIDWDYIVQDVVECHSGLKTEQVINIALKQAYGDTAHGRGVVRNAMHRLADEGVLRPRKVFNATEWFKA